ncbi:MAG TPA: hypothetical protein VEX66_09880 [Microlunatus sp.]|nr:hypothetical protein [Microlunatus sp.]
MNHDYVTSLLVQERLAGFRHEAEQDRLGRLARAGQPQQRRWWERLMLFRTFQVTGAHRPAATVAASESPC